jgi:hypothetical protein
MAKKSIAALLVTVVLAGCATTALDPAQALPVPAERLLLQDVAGADATLTVVRDAGFRGSGCFVALHVNRKLAARMGSGEIAHFKVPAGDVLLSVSRDPLGQALCGPTLDTAVIQREFAIARGERKAFRVTSGYPGFDIMRSDF